MEPIVRVGVGVCVFKDGKVLMGLRGPLCAQGSGSWSPPGGKLDFGESFEDCARRETLEEAGITISKPTFVTCTNDIFKEDNKHYITIYMRADWISGKPRELEPGKMGGWTWYEWTQLPEQLFFPFSNLLGTGFKP
ncbi:MAG TPA: NUDIX domain-containing protein [Candidatus Saccharimonadales bacterium]|nr:NUDIX domain-containing protein [Candidatus Saccharimonadales bacterium]